MGEERGDGGSRDPRDLGPAACRHPLSKVGKSSCLTFASAASRSSAQSLINMQPYVLLVESSGQLVATLLIAVPVKRSSPPSNRSTYAGRHAADQADSCRSCRHNVAQALVPAWLKLYVSNHTPWQPRVIASRCASLLRWRKTIFGTNTCFSRRTSI